MKSIIKERNLCSLVVYNIKADYLYFISQNLTELKIIKSPFIQNSHIITISCSVLKEKYLTFFNAKEIFNILFIIYNSRLFTKADFFNYLTSKKQLSLTTKNALYFNFYISVYKYKFFKFFFILQKLLLLK